MIPTRRVVHTNNCQLVVRLAPAPTSPHESTRQHPPPDKPTPLDNQPHTPQRDGLNLRSRSRGSEEKKEFSVTKARKTNLEDADTTEKGKKRGGRGVEETRAEKQSTPFDTHHFNPTQTKHTIFRNQTKNGFFTLRQIIIYREKSRETRHTSQSDRPPPSLPIKSNQNRGNKFYKFKRAYLVVLYLALCISRSLRYIITSPPSHRIK